METSYPGPRDQPHPRSVETHPSATQPPALDVASSARQLLALLPLPPARRLREERVAGPKALVDRVKPEVLERLGAKGGGPPGRLQGKATRLDRREEVGALLASAAGGGRPSEG